MVINQMRTYESTLPDVTAYTEKLKYVEFVKVLV